MSARIRRRVNPSSPRRVASAVSRREWLGTALVFPALANAARGQTQAPSKFALVGEQQILRRVQDRATKAGLGLILHDRTEHFFGLGDAPPQFLAEALHLCEALEKAFLSYFVEHHFAVTSPGSRLTVIALRGAVSYRAFIGEDPPPNSVGHYDIESNELVVYDNRSRQDEFAATAGRVNLFALAHEAAHLLSFNTGLLSRQADVPVCISEGLATFVEMWQPRVRSPIGASNRPWLAFLRTSRGRGADWIPIGELIAKDEFFDQPATTNLAYAESWLLVHTLIKTAPAWLSKFQAYLAGIPKEQGAKARLGYAEARLGSLGSLDREVRRHMARELER